MLEILVVKAFISYSHRDDWALDRLHTHFAMLRREGQITEWYDRNILAGKDIDHEISEQLESCALFLPLVSPDFLASTYCYEREMTRALVLHNAGEIRIVPIIVEPCDWKASPLGRLKALPRDSKPIVNWPNQNEAFLDIVSELRRVLTELKTGDETDIVTSNKGNVRSESQYRIRRTFDQIDRSDFRERTFAEIRDHFKASCEELNSIDGVRGRFLPKNSQGFACTVINQNMERGTAHITVYMATDFPVFGDIYYSFSENALPNSMNGGFHIESDDYDLFLKPSMFQMTGYSSDSAKLSAQDAAELLWSEFIEQAGLSRS